MSAPTLCANVLALLVTMLGCAQMPGCLTGSRVLRGLGGAEDADELAVAILPRPRDRDDVWLLSSACVR